MWQESGKVKSKIQNVFMLKESECGRKGYFPRGLVSSAASKETEKPKLGVKFSS